MARPRARYALHDESLDARIEELVAGFLSARRGAGAEAPASAEEAELARQLVVTCLRLLGDPASTGELRMVNAALKELRHAFRVFAPFEHIRKVAVFGSARTRPEAPEWQQAHAFAARMAEAGWMVITGAGDGIMGAAQGGAGRHASFGVNIRLPFEQRANEVIAGDPKLINFRYFFTRKVAFVKEAHGIALFPGGFGTHDEGFEALTLIQTGKSEIVPVVFVDAPGGDYWRGWLAWMEDKLRARGLVDEDDFSLFRVTDDLDQAVAEVQGFYRNYHSSRYVGDRLLLRVRRAPDAAALAELNRDFADVLERGAIEVGGELPAERGEAPGLPRVILRFDRRSVARLRQLIDRLNALALLPAPVQDASPHQIVAVPLANAADEAADEEE